MLFHIILLTICWLNSSSLFQTILTYFAPLNISQIALSYILIIIKTVLSLINVSLTWSFNFQGNCWCSTERGCQFSRLESSFLQDRELQGQVSILVMPETALYLAQPLFFSFGEVRKRRVRKCFALGRSVRKIHGSRRIFFCLSPPFPVTLYCFWDETNASRPTQAVLTKLDRKHDTPATQHPWTWTLRAFSFTHKQVRLRKHSPPFPVSFLQLSAGCFCLWISPQAWGSCSHLWFHQASQHSCH